MKKYKMKNYLIKHYFGHPHSIFGFTGSGFATKNYSKLIAQHSINITSIILITKRSHKTLKFSFK